MKILYVVIADMHTKSIVREYWMNYANENQRRVLGAQAKSCFEAMQSVWTCPVREYDQTPDQCYGALTP